MFDCHLKSALSVSLLSCWVAVSSGRAQDQAIYTDTLQNGWANWSYSTTCDFNSPTPVHGGTRSVAVTITAAWGAFSLWHGNFDSTPYSDLTFWIHGGTSGGQQLRIYGELNGAGQPAVDLPLPVAGTWQQVTVSLASLGVANSPNFSRFSVQDRSGSAQPTFYLDDIRLVAAGSPSPAIALTSPANGAVYSAPATIPLSATVTANGHTLNKVGFYNGTTLLVEDTTPPYSGTWSNVAVGSYTVTARVTYDGSNTLASAAANCTVATNSLVAITVDAQLNRHAISPLIYGVAFASSSDLLDLNAPLNRSGGNAETRYNWQLDAHNRGNDWYFISLADGGGTAGQSADDFVTTSRNGGAEPMLTVPMIGWAAKLGASRAKLASYSVSKYGPQTATEPGWPDIGNGISVTNNMPITWNDPNDANFQTNATFQAAWLTHLTNRWGMSTNGGVRYYFMDNEHSIWHSTHRDVHPNGASRTEIRDKFFDYAGKVKAADPNAIVLGPEEFGWSGYFNSGADLQYGDQHGWSYLPDRATNGNLDYVCWLLKELHQRDTNTNQRLLDYFTLHRYTEDSAVGGEDVSTTTQLKRNRWTRSFWDTNYVDESWIGSQPENKVMLIPRMKGWVASYYPGTKIGITEYNWGAEGHINGATTQADILGIYGRESLDLATRWTTPAASTPTYKAMKLFRNYDGNKSGFGDTSVSAAGPNPDNVSTFAAVRSPDAALTVLVINKQLASGASTTVSLANFMPAGTAQVWQLTSANAITRLSDISFSGTTFTSTVPAQSITLFVLPAAVLVGPASNPNPASGATGVASHTSLSWEAGTNATWHRVYFGTSSNVVANATTNAPEFKGDLAGASFAPGVLAASGRFCWRVDELAGTCVVTGPVWTFATTVSATNTFPLEAGLGSGDTFVISFPSQVGQTYRVERSASLSPAAWAPVADHEPGTGAAIQIPDPGVSPHAQRFYRVVILSP